MGLKQKIFADVGVISSPQAYNTISNCNVNDQGGVQTVAPKSSRAIDPQPLNIPLLPTKIVGSATQNIEIADGQVRPGHAR